MIFKELDEGGVLFCSESEVYFGLNPVGVRIWRHLSDEPEDLNGLAARLSDDYPDVDRATLESDISDFLDELRESALVRYTSDDGDRTG